MDEPSVGEPGPLIASARKAAGLKKAGVARVSSVERSLTSRIEDGELIGSLRSVVLLFWALGIDLNLLKPKLPPPALAERNERRSASAA